MSDRRSFLRSLASLPLIGGGVTLIGNPTAAAVPVTDDLLWSYKAWLHYEHRMLCHEMAGHDQGRAEAVEGFIKLGYPGDRYHFGWGGRRDLHPGKKLWEVLPQPSTRAAVVLSAVGCPLIGGPNDA